jgi:anthranilate phosphoribosyltransferase
MAGGDPRDNARLLLDVLRGTAHELPRAAVIINAAAAIYVGGAADSLVSALDTARHAIDSGAALHALERLRTAAGRAEPAA